jgi:hypothetical protein
VDAETSSAKEVTPASVHGARALAATACRVPSGSDHDRVIAAIMKSTPKLRPATPDLLDGLAQSVGV